MSSVELQYLSADAVGLPEWARPLLAERPHPRRAGGLVVPDTLGAIARRVSGAPDKDARADLVERLEGHLTRCESHVRVLESVRALAHPEAAVVIAGQQPGFLGGPLYDAYKALHAIRLARALEELWDTPVVPAFWNHADDHDIAEVHHLWVRNQNLDLRKVGLAGVSSGRTPFSELVLSSERHRLDAARELLRQTLFEGPELEPALELFVPHDGETFSRAFTRVLLGLFGKHGLVPIEPDWIRAPLSSALASLVGGDLRAGLELGVERLAAEGVEPAIDPDGAALLFHHEGGKRSALRFAGTDFRYDGEEGSRTGAELAAEIIQAPAEWSAGALLRPLLQDSVLPVVAYIGGWGELSYHMQLPALREHAGIERTAFVPRLSATLVDRETQRSLDKLGLDVKTVLAARGKLGEEEEDGEESEVASRLRAIGRDARSALLAEKEGVAALDPGLAQQLKKAASQVTGSIEKLSLKLDRVRANSAGRGRRHHRRLNTTLFPRESPQERVRGTLEVVARHGTRWLDELAREIDPLPTEHLVVNLDPGEPA